MSNFPVLSTPVTSTPNARASCHGERTHTTTRAVNQDLVPWLYLSLLANTQERDECGGGYGRCLFKREVGRLQRQHVLRNRHKLGIGAAVLPLVAADGLAKYLIT